MKIDALINLVGTYGSALAVSASAQIAAQATAIHPSPDIFWPAFGGAATSALLTIKPAFQGKSEEAPRDVAFLAFITLIVGFLFAFFLSDYLNGARIAGMIGPMDAPPTVAAFGCAFFGERILSIVWSKTPSEWWDIITSIKFGAKK